MERHRGQGRHQVELEHFPLIAHGTLSTCLYTKLFLTASPTGSFKTRRAHRSSLHTTQGEDRHAAAPV
jgi:hypothetical protein